MRMSTKPNRCQITTNTDCLLLNRPSVESTDLANLPFFKLETLWLAQTPTIGRQFTIDGTQEERKKNKGVFEGNSMAIYHSVVVGFSFIDLTIPTP